MAKSNELIKLQEGLQKTNESYPMQEIDDSLIQEEINRLVKAKALLLDGGFAVLRVLSDKDVKAIKPLIEEDEESEEFKWIFRVTIDGNPLNPSRSKYVLLKYLDNKFNKGSLWLVNNLDNHDHDKLLKSRNDTDLRAEIAAELEKYGIDKFIAK